MSSTPKIDVEAIARELGYPHIQDEFYCYQDEMAGLVINEFITSPHFAEVAWEKGTNFHLGYSAGYWYDCYKVAKEDAAFCNELKAKLDEAVGLLTDMGKLIQEQQEFIEEVGEPCEEHDALISRRDKLLASLDTNQKCMKPDNSMQKNGKVNDGRLEGEGAK